MKKTKKIIGCTWILLKGAEILMMLRDKKPNIPYPDSWVFPGGTLEGRETVRQACIRELKEELGYTPPSMEEILVIHYPNSKTEEHFFLIPFNLEEEQIKLGEGQKVKFFTLDEIENLCLGFWCREVIPIVKRYLLKKAKKE